jgi:hypothetical protein
VLDVELKDPNNQVFAHGAKKAREDFLDGRRHFSLPAVAPN